MYTFFPRGPGEAAFAFEAEALPSEGDAVQRANRILEEQTFAVAVEVWREEQAAFVVYRER